MQHLNLVSGKNRFFKRLTTNYASKLKSFQFSSIFVYRTSAHFENM